MSKVLLYPFVVMTQMQQWWTPNNGLSSVCRRNFTTIVSPDRIHLRTVHHGQTNLLIFGAAILSVDSRKGNTKASLLVQLIDKHTTKRRSCSGSLIQKQLLTMIHIISITRVYDLMKGMEEFRIVLGSLRLIPRTLGNVSPVHLNKLWTIFYVPQLFQ